MVLTRLKNMLVFRKNEAWLMYIFTSGNIETGDILADERSLASFLIHSNVTQTLIQGTKILITKFLMRKEIRLHRSQPYIFRFKIAKT